jgi:ATP-dependent RNA helicase RhlE
LVSADEVDLLSAIERLIQMVLPRRELEGFEPDQAVKETTLNHPIYSKKPRKPLKSQTNESNNSRHRNDSNKRKRHSEYGQGPQPGKKAKRGGRNQAPKSDPNSHNSVKGNSENGDGKSLERGFSPYGNSKKLENTNSGRRRPSGGNSNRGSGRARTR